MSYNFLKRKTVLVHPDFCCSIFNTALLKMPFAYLLPKIVCGYIGIAYKLQLNFPPSNELLSNTSHLLLPSLQNPARNTTLRLNIRFSGKTTHVPSVCNDISFHQSMSEFRYYLTFKLCLRKAPYI